MIYIFDIDGTLADVSHRLHYITGETKDWDAFFAACGDDKPIFEVITVARALANMGNNLVYSTGRPSTVEVKTTGWMDKYRVPLVNEGHLFMRTAGDHREDNEVKAELYDKIIARFPGAVMGGVFEDRQQCVDMYRARGLRVFQVAKGDF
jgi:phosphoglycolate phosphatase-like HAD superfamily hydrolase